MARPDEGDFDLVVEIADATLTSAARARVVAPPTRTFSNPNVTGDVTPAVSVTSVTVSSPNVLTVRLDLTGTTMHLSTVTLFGAISFDIPPDQQTIQLAGGLTLSGLLSIGGLALVVDFSANPAVPEPTIDESINDAIFASLPIQFVIARLMLSGALLDQARMVILGMFRDQLVQTLRGTLTANGPIALLPPPTIPMPATPVSGATFMVGLRSLVMLYTLGGAPGTPTLITRSNLTRSNAGVPTDAAALVLSNACLLRDFVRPAATAAFGLAPSGFSASHPCFWTGSAALTLPAGTSPLITGATLTFLLAGIDGTSLRVLMSITASGAAFTVASTIDTTLSVSIGPGGTSLRVSIPPAIPPVVASQISIAAWVYIAAFFTGGLLFAAIVAAIDGLGNGMADGTIGAAIVGAAPSIAIPLTLPAGAPAVSIKPPLNLRQSDAITRSIVLFPSIVIPDPFPAHDLIVHVV